jgi:hypothetical protein
MMPLTNYSKVGANIRSEHRANGLVESREKRKNHSEDSASTLLTVPRYADILEGGEDSESEEEEAEGSRSMLVKSAKSWRRVMDKWIEQEREASEEDSDTDQPAITGTERRSKPWLPRSLGLLFGGRAKQPIGRSKRQPYDEETRMMELLAAEYEDEPPDDGELEGSGDDYELA